MGKRFVLKGYFSFRDNNLFYRPTPTEKNKIPHKIKILGTWRLDQNHNLVFIVDKAQNRFFGNSLKFSTKVMKAKKNYLVFSLLKRITPTQRKINRIYLKGSWHLSRFNQLSFWAKRERGVDEIVFKKTFKLDKNNYIFYRYNKRFGKRKISESFTLKGRWGIARNAITYYIENSKTARLSYGGSWRLKGKHVEFVAEFKEKPRVWRFEVKKKLEKGKVITFAVLDKRGKPLGFELTFSKKIAKDGKFLLKLRGGREKRVNFGFYLPF